MAQDEEYSIFLEVVMCFHPTDYDQTGVDGVYVKEVKLDSRSPTLRAPDKGDTSKSPLQTCVWTCNDDEESCSYDTACGSAYYFIDGDLDENEVKFCFHCGKPIST